MQQDVIRTIAAMTEAFQCGDVDAVLSHYTEDAAVAFEPGKPVSGAAALRAGFEAFTAVTPVFHYDRGHDVMISGDVAVHIAPWTMTGTAPDGTAITEQGLSVATLRRQPDTTWKIAVDNPYGDHLLTATE
ncbi:YybH family protein [Nocardia otitidiscaviarum]|uniref:YybH family protein n=1 Tax=Nocardia otitidiscaviarum TaxID=1823 RepID=UPI001896268F|nr:nuclear transport factor 2 family protein [Nocardia otitidiscaviarum]MBF6178198.1 nuclear transport factor 2 family protein [Nocardia otitidiscaviarum]